MALQISTIYDDFETCPMCGSFNVSELRRNSPDAEAAATSANATADACAERIRRRIAADGADVPQARGPDHKLLLAGLVAWIGAAGYAWMSQGLPLAPWTWGALLVVVAVLGAWADRRAARKRGWIGPMERAERIVNEALCRSAAARAPGSPAERVEAAPSVPARDELRCEDCGHRFATAASELATPA